MRKRVSRLVLIWPLIFFIGEAARADEPFFDIHTHYNWDAAEIIAPEQVIETLKKFNVEVAVVFSTPSDYALKLREAGGDRIIPFFSPYITGQSRHNWFRDRRVLMLAEKGLSAVFLGSSDLTHYGPNYGFSPKGTGSDAVDWVKNENDRSIIDKAVSMDAIGVIEDQRTRRNTCSAGPIASVVTSAADRGIAGGTLIEYYTSYDVMPGSSFVGYAAIVY